MFLRAASRFCIRLKSPSIVDKEIPFCPTLVLRYQRISPTCSSRKDLENNPTPILLRRQIASCLHSTIVHGIVVHCGLAFYGPQTLSEGRSLFALRSIVAIHYCKSNSPSKKSSYCSHKRGTFKSLAPAHFFFKNFQQPRSSNTRNTITTTIQPQPLVQSSRLSPNLSLSLFNLPYHVEQSKAQALRLRAAQPRSGGPNPSHEEGKGGGKPLNVRGRHEH